MAQAESLLPILPILIEFIMFIKCLKFDIDKPVKRSRKCVYR